jgi:uncharacterized protein YbjT (DUF2867 family)
MSIAITGSTGGYGCRLIKTLSTLVPPAEIIAITRSTSSDRAQALPAGVHLRQADFGDAAALTSAFDGAEIAMIVSVDKIGPEAVELHKTAIDAAVSAGVRKVYYTSHQNASPDSLFAAARDHYETEQYLAGSGIQFTSLRNGFYQGSLKYMIGGVEHTNVIDKPADGKVSWTNNDDLADAAAVLLARDFRGDKAGEYVTLVSSENADMADVAKSVGQALGKDVQRKVMGDQAFVDATEAHGVPRHMAEMFLGMFKEARRGGFLSDDGTLKGLLGRKPTTVDAFLKEAYGKA